MSYILEFFGYTWDDFFHVISDKEGLLVTYMGCLNHEGAPLMKEILFIDYGKRLGDIFNSDCFKTIKSELGRSEMLFYAYAPTNEIDGIKIKETLIRALKPRLNNDSTRPSKIELHCKGACALFPKHLLAE